MSDKTAPHILIVDDDDEVREMLLAVLGEAGFRASCAKDARAARRAIDEGDLIDAAVIDAVMPGELGASLAEHVHGLGVPVVLISGNPEAMQVDALERIPCTRLNKPFRADAVIAAVRTALETTGVETG